MSLTSLHFYLFFLVVYLLYLILNHRWQNRMLLAASYVFYGSWDWRFIPLLLFATWISYYSGIKISRTSEKSRQLNYLRLTLFVELGLLGLFKYFNFFIGNVIDLLHHLGLQVSPFPIQIILPLGISYYTFQAIAYSVDVYRGVVPASEDFVEFALFKSFFPILFGGPIERASNLLRQVGNARKVDASRFQEGLYLLGWGLFKKMYVSDHVAPLVDGLFGASPGLNGAETWVAAYGFAIQLYCDISGYTDIARGLGKLLGFDLAQNFNLPYIAKNPVDFWRRNHISLSSWFGDYFCQPLFFWTKNIYFALFFTFFLVGVWHGASWNFVILGVWNGFLMATYVFIRPHCRFFLEPESPRLRSLVSVLSIIVMFHLNCVGFIFFRAVSLEQVGVMLSHLVHGPYELTSAALDGFAKLAFFAAPVALMQIAQVLTGDLNCFLKVPRKLQFAACLGAAYLVALVYLFSGQASQGGTFIYFHF